VIVLCYYADHNEVIGAGRGGIVGIISGAIVGDGIILRNDDDLMFMYSFRGMLFVFN